jgi:hypothetical protein
LGSRSLAGTPSRARGTWKPNLSSVRVSALWMEPLRTASIHARVAYERERGGLVVMMIVYDSSGSIVAVVIVVVIVV